VSALSVTPSGLYFLARFVSIACSSMSALPPSLPSVRDTAVLPVGLAASANQTPLAQHRR